MNDYKIVEYTTTILIDPETGRIWVNKRNNPTKEFYGSWQSPGGHKEETDISIRFAAQREVFEETGIYIHTGNLHYWRTEHYYREKEWRIVYCFKAYTHKIPKLTEPTEMTEWELKEKTEILKEPIIESLENALTREAETETTIILVEGSCGVGKSTFVRNCKIDLVMKGLRVEVLDESFITYDKEKRIVKYAQKRRQFQNKEITQEEMRKEAIDLEEWIRDTWMEQIHDCLTRKLIKNKPDVIIMDRNLFSTEIFMQTMEKERLITKQDIERISENYKYWKPLLQEALVIWWNTPKEETIKRLTQRNRPGEEDIKYFSNLYETYRENILKIYPNIKIITNETKVKRGQIEEYIEDIIDEKKIYSKIRPRR